GSVNRIRDSVSWLKSGRLYTRSRRVGQRRGRPRECGILSAMAWDPAQYLKFADHRLRPAVDLLNRVDLDNPGEIYDLGAGAGNVTRLIKERWPAARVTGVDDSEAMLAKAAATAPSIAWRQADLATWRPTQPADLISSNAALHWLPGHERVFPALLGGLASGGVLAVQMPRNFGARARTPRSPGGPARPPPAPP